MQETVQDCVGDCFLPEDFTPAGYGQLADDDGGFSAVPVLDEFHQVELVLFFQMGKAEVVQDEQISFGDAVKELDCGAFESGHFGFEHEFLGVQVGGFESQQTGLVPEGGSQIALAATGGSGDEYRFPFFEVIRRGQGSQQEVI